MEKNNTYGIYFNWKDIEALIDEQLGWVEVVENQVFCITNVMNDNTPIGTSIAVRVDGIKCEEGSDTLRLIMSNGVYSLVVKTMRPNDELDMRFHQTISVNGTYGCIVDGVLDILTEEEKKFKKLVDDQLEYRSDTYANEFRRLNTRTPGGRGLLLLEKIKAEIQCNDILLDASITPEQLISSFIEMTERYVVTSDKIGKLIAKREELVEQHKRAAGEGSRMAQKLARNIEVVDRKLATNRDVNDFCLATINAAIKPVLAIDVGR